MLDFCLGIGLTLSLSSNDDDIIYTLLTQKVFESTYANMNYPH